MQGALKRVRAGKQILPWVDGLLVDGLLVISYWFWEDKFLVTLEIKPAIDHRPTIIDQWSTTLANDHRSTFKDT
jgi:hypothetical protein